MSLLVAIQNIFVILHRNCVIKALERARTIEQGTTLRKSDTARFVFGLFEPEKLELLIKDNAEVTPMDVYIRSRSVPRVHVTLTHTFGCNGIYSCVGILLCSFY